MKEKVRNRILKHVRESAEGLYKAGAITAEELRDFDSCYTPKIQDVPPGGTVRETDAPLPAYAQARL